MRRIVPILLAGVLATSCSSGPKADPSAGLPPAAKRVPHAPVLVPSAPLVKMSSGTDLVEGVLAEWCEGKACKRAQSTRPLRYLPGKANGLLLFTASAAPARATVELRRRDGRLVSKRDVVPGTTMAYAAHARLPKGKYRVVLNAAWGKREGRWVFGVLGPLGSND